MSPSVVNAPKTEKIPLTNNQAAKKIATVTMVAPGYTMTSAPRTMLRTPITITRPQWSAIACM